MLVPADLTPFADIDEAKAAAMIEDAEAMATLAAPCIASPEFVADEAKVGALKAILRGAILRWVDAGSGAVQTQVSGPFSNTVQYQGRKGMFWPTEIEQLRGLCSTGGSGAFSVDTAPSLGKVSGYWSAPDAWTPLS